jgi:type IV pilus assembly protein PilY1
MKPLLTPRTAGVWWRWLALLLPLLSAGWLMAATTDLSNTPLFASNTSSVKPNVMFILDDSGSMNWDYAPDEANFSNATNPYGYKSYQCNAVAYNPSITYSPPLKFDGSSYPNIAFEAAPSDGFAATNSSVTTSSLQVKTGTVTFTMSTQPNVNTQVLLQASSATNNYVIGKVSAKSGTSVTVNFTTAVGSGSYTSWLLTTSTGTNLNNATYYSYQGTQTQFGYTFNTAGVITSTTFYQECNSSVGSSPGSNVFTAVVLDSSSSTAQRQNYANWYGYYRWRMGMMKSSVGKAFQVLDNRYRVGFSVISNTSAAGTNFVDVADFDTAQKTKFFNALYGTSGNSSTPLRGALAKAGQYFANKANGQTVDPMQYSCQKNFTILSTDGYWNTGGEQTTAPKYGPYQLDNSTNVGQQDGPGTARPMFDGNSLTTTTTTRWTQTSNTLSITQTPSSRQNTTVTTTTTSTPVNGWSQNNYSYYTSTSATNSRINTCSAGSTPCTITVTTSVGLGLPTGSTFTAVLSGVSQSGYNGIYTATVRGSLTYTFSLASRPGTSATSPYGSSAVSADNTCPAGQVRLLAQQQVRDESTVSTATTTAITVTPSTTVQTVSVTVTTPYTQVVKVTDGVLTSNTTTPGTPSTTRSTVTATVTGTVTTNASTSTVAGTNTFSAWTNNGAATQGSCVSTLPSPNPSTSTQLSGPSTTTATVSTSTSTSSSTSTGSSTVSTLGPTQASSTPTTTSTSVSTGGASDTLADVAMYYYLSDLRTSALGNCTGALGIDVCTNNVQGSDPDTATQQHMTTFTLGLAAGGTLRFDPNYLSQKSGDFYNLISGATNWPIPGGNKGPENVDDLWHAAVNGRGKYFSATDATSLALGLNTSLNAIKAITGSSGAAATSTLQPVQGNNDVFMAQFTSIKWYGDLLSYKIDPATGAVAGSVTWAAGALLDAMDPNARNIYYRRPGTQQLRAFTSSNLSNDGLSANFQNFCSKPGLGGSNPTQCAILNTNDLNNANSASNLVDYLRGATSYSYYRSRDHVLGDIVNASPMFVGKPEFRYTENSYASFASANANRTAVVYAAANDGMLHAFDRLSGQELWTYIPTAVIPNLYKLADTSFQDNHVYSVDGSPIMGDIYINGGWHTILVGGLNAGGRSYYALDVTDPGNPQVLWEFSSNDDADLGYSYGNPVIGKLANGSWVVVFGSGYNNVNPGDGNGHLFVLNAYSGALLKKINTYTDTTQNTGTIPAGTTATPSGLAKINAFVFSETDNTLLRIYGGDLLGNVWRFDLDNLVLPYSAAFPLAKLQVNNQPQPVTTEPALSQLFYGNQSYEVVFVGTGKYLGLSDLSTTSQQSVYAIKDTLGVVPLGDIHASTAFVTQTLSTSTNASNQLIRTTTLNPVNWVSQSGWKLDLLSPGERINVSPKLVLNTLFFGSNVPGVSACSVGGTSWLYKLDTTTGSSVNGAIDNAAGVSLGNVLIAGMTPVVLGNGSTSATGNTVATIITRSDGTLGTVTGTQPPANGTLRRTSWRELAN